MPSSANDMERRLQDERGRGTGLAGSLEKERDTGVILGIAYLYSTGGSWSELHVGKD
jgi:hypothetical protein